MGLAEQETQTPIMKYINRNGGVAYKVSSPTRGVPDISAVYKGKSLWVEAKTYSGKASKMQEYQIERLRQAGAIAFVAHSEKEFIEKLHEYGLE